MQHIRDHHDSDLGRFKEAVVARAVDRRFQGRGCRDSTEYLRLLREEPAEADRLLEELFVGTTRFFRDPELFARLADTWLPQLLERAAPDRPLRVWVVGCATGEEAYSSAMVLAEAVGPAPGAQRVKIFATDVDPRAIEVARAGRYPRSVAADVGPRRLERFFVAGPSELRVAPILREMLVFAPHDLLRDPPLLRIDLLVCRNVLICLDRAAQKQILGRLSYALRSDGLLVLGPSESADELFVAVDPRWGIHRPREAPPRFTPMPPAPGPLRPGAVPGTPAQELRSANEELQTLAEELEASNEELRAQNQELDQANAELNGRVREATRVSDETASVLDSAGVAILALDDRLVIRRFNRQITALIPLVDADVGRPVAEIAPRLSGADLPAVAARVLRTLVPAQVAVTAEDGARMLLRVRPLRTSDNVIEGLVLVFIDVSEIAGPAGPATHGAVR